MYRYRNNHRHISENNKSEIENKEILHQESNFMVILHIASEFERT